MVKYWLMFNYWYFYLKFDKIRSKFTKLTSILLLGFVKLDIIIIYLCDLRHYSYKINFNLLIESINHHNIQFLRWTKLQKRVVIEIKLTLINYQLKGAIVMPWGRARVAELKLSKVELKIETDRWKKHASLILRISDYPSL